MKRQSSRQLLAEEERSKYERMWATEQYRKAGSPSSILLNRLPVGSWLKEFEIKSVLDAGCGSGTLLKEIKRLNPAIDVRGMDIAENAVDFRLKDVFIRQCLWEPFPDKKYGAIFSIDVLEHIPTDKIDAVLDNFSRSFEKFVFMSICLVDDKYGKLIGEALHLTVKDCFWWFDKLRMHGFGIKFSLINEITLDALCVKS